MILGCLEVQRTRIMKKRIDVYLTYAFIIVLPLVLSSDAFAWPGADIVSYVRSTAKGIKRTVSRMIYGPPTYVPLPQDVEGLLFSYLDPASSMCASRINKSFNRTSKKGYVVKRRQEIYLDQVIKNAPLISAGANNTCVILENGKTECWGHHPDGRSVPPTDLDIFLSVSVGGGHSCAIRKSGMVKCWGDNSSGQSTPPADLGAVVSVSAGWNHACAIRVNGKVWCWGSGQVTPPADLGAVVSVSAGASHTCAIRVNGKVRCWGAAADILLPPAKLGKVLSVSVGGSYACAVQVTGAPMCWRIQMVAPPTPPADLGKTLSVSAGFEHICAIQENGQVMCWGDNSEGKSTPPADLGPVLSVSAGMSHTCAVQVTGNVVCWGRNFNHQNGQTISFPDSGKIRLPHPVSALDELD